MTEERYKLSFTTGALLVREAGVAAPLYLEFRDWAEVRRRLDGENLLQARTVSSARRLGREVVQRLSALTDPEIRLFIESTAIERGHLMWVAACRRYRLVGEFAEEVVRERFLLLAPTLVAGDFDSFVRSKAVWHDELAEMAESTHRRLRSNVFLMLREAGLLSQAGQIVPTALSARVSDVLAESDLRDIRFFPTQDASTVKEIL
jgi:hypothetical protein